MLDGRLDEATQRLLARPFGVRAGVIRRFDINSPFDGSVVGTAPDTDCRTIAACFERAVIAAGTLHTTRVVQERLCSWAKRIAVHREKLARTISLETGKPIRFARVEVLTALATLDLYCSSPAVSLAREWTTAQVTFGILNWCDPVLSLITETVAALSNGRALLVKPSTRASLSSLSLAALWNEGDDLDGLLCVAPSTDAIGMLRAALMHSRVSEVRFRGSREVGSYILRACDEALVPVTVTTVTRSPLAVDEHSDIESVCDSIVERAFFPPLRAEAERVSCLYIPDSIGDSAVSALISRVSQLHVGDPLDEQTDVGPLIDDVAATLLEEQIEEAVAAGAALPVIEPAAEPRHFRPVILDYAHPSMRVCQGELEGPLLPVVRYKHPDEVQDAQMLNADSTP
ncbi:aldehyde dehydrogenase family protein [Caballeronia sp. LZ019]|uniref:aldehyde dehydrogenase family protein n=1 Tax=Caballeronia sp. LZ019 TaxID=3038555 RepID=UPI00285B943F|nr:aldehyde dehydrogenase family protein [Caballeronia sp. LZ019]MDR5810660.1 aldehyde dehydrogenase family protein [Caballeronia sp. LZ019]